MCRSFTDRRKDFKLCINNSTEIKETIITCFTQAFKKSFSVSVVRHGHFDMLTVPPCMTWLMHVCSPVLAQPITSFLLSQLPVWPVFLAHTIEVLLIGWWISFSVLEHRSLHLIWFKVMETLSQLSYSSGCSCLLVSGCYRRAPRSWTHSWPFREDECDHFHFTCWFQEQYDRTSLQSWTVIWHGLLFKLEPSSVLPFSCLYYLDFKLFSIIPSSAFATACAEQGTSAISWYISDTPWMYCCHIIMHCLLLIISVTWSHLKPPVKSVPLSSKAEHAAG